MSTDLPLGSGKGAQPGGERIGPGPICDLTIREGMLDFVSARGIAGTILLATLLILSSCVLEKETARLKDENPQVRVKAAKFLGQIKHKPMVEPSMLVLKDEDPAVRATAAWALGEIKSSSSVNSLVSSLGACCATGS